MQAWENHLLRNQSLIVDLFHGQLRSQVRCKECGKVSVRFDPYSYLSLPLPMDSCIHLEILGKLLPVFDPTSDYTHTPHTHTPTPLPTPTHTHTHGLLYTLRNPG